jgi:hypothetical protein
MTSQLLERIVRRVIGLREALGVLSANSFEIVPEQGQTDEELRSCWPAPCRRWNG